MNSSTVALLPVAGKVIVGSGGKIYSLNIHLFFSILKLSEHHLDDTGCMCASVCGRLSVVYLFVPMYFLHIVHKLNLVINNIISHLKNIS